MGSRGRFTVVLASLAALGTGALSISAALAQSGEAPAAGSPQQLLDRLDELDGQLPGNIVPTSVAFADDASWITLGGDAGSVRAVLDTVEPDLRQLFIAADQANGDVSDAIASIAAGWLDVWTGTAALAVAEVNDLAFPIGTTDDGGVATGADVLRGQVEIGLRLVVAGHTRLHDGYVALHDLEVAEADVQARLGARVAAVEAWDASVLPRAQQALGHASSSVLVPIDRFDTNRPGVEPRATAMTAICVDRAALDALGGIVTDAVLEELANHQVDRPDCP